MHFLFSAVLLWLLTAACIKTGRPQIARRAIELAESRLLKDGWPEYYDGKLGRYVGKQARKFQTWSIAGYLVAKMMLEDPSHLGMISLAEDKDMKPLIKRSTSWTCWQFPTMINNRILPLTQILLQQFHLSYHTKCRLHYVMSLNSILNKDEFCLFGDCFDLLHSKRLFCPAKIAFSSLCILSLGNFDHFKYV